VNGYREGDQGQWVSASRIRGLLDGEPNGKSRATQTSTPSVGATRAKTVPQSKIQKKTIAPDESGERDIPGSAETNRANVFSWVTFLAFGAGAVSGTVVTVVFLVFGLDSSPDGSTAQQRNRVLSVLGEVVELTRTYGDMERASKKTIRAIGEGNFEGMLSNLRTIVDIHSQSGDHESAKEAGNQVIAALEERQVKLSEDALKDADRQVDHTTTPNQGERL